MTGAFLSGIAEKHVVYIVNWQDGAGVAFIVRAGY
jgi:hypothetical protein